MFNYNNNLKTSKFNNIKNLFTFRSIGIISVTIIISFSLRCLIIYLFNLDLTQFYDFFFVSFLVSFIRPLITDLVDFYLINRVSLLTMDVSCYTRRHSDKHKHNHHSDYQSRSNNQSLSDIESHNIHDELNYKDRVKRRLFWFVWKQYTDKFSSYNEFKKSWDVNTKLRDDIKNDIKDSSDIKKLRKIKRTILWFWNPNK